MALPEQARVEGNSILFRRNSATSQDKRLWLAQ